MAERKLPDGWLGSLLLFFLAIIMISVGDVSIYGQESVTDRVSGETPPEKEKEAEESGQLSKNIHPVKDWTSNVVFTLPGRKLGSSEPNERDDDQSVAESAGQTRPADSFRSQVSVYLWLPHVTGRVRPLAIGPTLNIDTSIRDVIKDSDGAVMLNGTFRKDRFVFLWDFNYSGSSKKGQAFLPIAGGIPLTASGKIRQTSVTFMAGASVLQRPRTTVDILGGVRVWRIKAAVEATLPPPFNVASRSRTWGDPLAGIRVRQHLTPKWSLILYGDGGGFNAGSRFSGQIAGTLNYQVTRPFYVSGGYRHLSVDYRKDGRLLDLEMSGPVIGVTWAF